MKAGRIGTTKRAFFSAVRSARCCVPVLLAALAVAGAGAVHAQTHSPAPAAAASPKAGAHTQAGAAGQPGNLKDASTIATMIPEPRRAQINGECADLLKMATTLKTEVDKTTKDELSVAVVLEAGRIEKLSRAIKDEMQPVLKKHRGRP